MKNKHKISWRAILLKNSKNVKNSFSVTKQNKMKE